MVRGADKLPLPEALELAAQRLARSRYLVVSTGAGVSAESGIPTFRDAQTGLWAKYDPVMLASIEGFRDDPALVWKWYDERRAAMRRAQPNPGHLTLSAWQELWQERGRRFQLITQNIDDLHGRAGSRGIIELHGNIWYARPLDGEYAEAQRLEDCPLGEYPPRDGAGRVLRPHVVWFGEMLDPGNIEDAFRSAAACDALIVAGSSSVVYPAAALPLYARRAGADVIEINPNTTELSALCDIRLRAPSGEALPPLLERVRALL